MTNKPIHSFSFVIPELVTDEILLLLAEKTKGTQWENRIWLVGGAIRNALLRVTGKKDYDLATDLCALELASYLYSIGVSFIEPVLYPTYGTSMVKILDTDIEFVSTRKEIYSSDSRKPTVSSSSIEDDLYRRDFTVNCFYYNIHSGELLGHPDSFRNLREKVLKTPLDPDVTFIDDPLRMLRAVRFKALNSGFQIASETLDSIEKNAKRLKIVSIERIIAEMNKIMSSHNIIQAIQTLDELGLLQEFLPELSKLAGSVSQEFLFLHTLRTIIYLKTENLNLKWAALLSHTDQTHLKIKQLCRRLKFSNDDTDQIYKLLEHQWVCVAYPLTDYNARKLLREFKQEITLLADLVTASIKADWPLHKVYSQAYIDNYEVNLTLLIKLLETENCCEYESPLNGEEIMSLCKIPQGIQVKNAKDFLVKAVLSGDLTFKDKDLASKMLVESKDYWSK